MLKREIKVHLKRFFVKNGSFLFYKNSERLLYLNWPWNMLRNICLTPNCYHIKLLKNLEMHGNIIQSIENIVNSKITHILWKTITI